RLRRVRPVERVVDPVRPLERQRQTAGLGAERSLAAIALLPDKAVRKDDARHVRLAGHRVLERVATALADALDPEGAPHPAALDDDPGLLQADDLEGGTEQLPRHPAELARADPRERLGLRLAGRRVDDEHGPAVAFVDRLRPVDDGRASHAAEVDIAAATARDRHADQRATAPVLGAGKAAEVAAAGEVAVAELVAVALEEPRRARR